LKFYLKKSEMGRKKKRMEEVEKGVGERMGGSGGSGVVCLSISPFL
jgi:hypothetical protein